MKKTTQKNILFYLIALAIISGLTILNSCSSCSDKENTTGKTSLSKNNTPSHVIDKNPILLWDYIRKDSTKVKAIFDSSGNRFSFIPNATYDKQTIHVYVGYNENPTIAKRLNFTFITKEADKDSINLLSINKKGLRSLKHKKFESYKDSIRKGKNHRDHIAWETAKQRINNWNNDTIRNKWITDQFKISDSTAIFQAFVINGIDFDYGDVHYCYLALKTDTVIGIDTTYAYTADLIIVNTKKKGGERLVSLVEGTVNLEDLTTPVPPFGEYAQDDFGLIEAVKFNWYQ